MKSTALQQGRIQAIDFARMLATIFMIQGHALDVLLAPQYRQGNFYDSWLFLRGLTAPMFLVLAGCSFTLASRPGADGMFGAPSTAWRRVRRFVGLILIGYVMHMPVRWFSDLRYADGAALQLWAQVDVLQCIGVSLLGLQALALITRKARRFAIATCAIGSLAVLISPLMWSSAAVGRLPLPLAAYLNGSSGSLFPLFPWSGYVFLGAAIGYLCATRPQRVSAMLALAGVMLAAGGVVLQKIPFTLYGPMDFWRTSPNVVLVRLGGVCLLVAIVGLATRWIPSLTSPSKILGRESLIAYVAHVFILYGSSWNIGLRQAVGATLNPAHTLLAILLLTLASVAVAFFWHGCKRAASRQISRFTVPQPQPGRA